VIREVDITARIDAGSAEVWAALRTGVFLVRHTVPTDLLDEAYALLEQWFALPVEVKLGARAPGTNGQAGYTPALVETAERGRVPDWKELFHWGRSLPEGHPLRRRHPARYPEPVFPDDAVPGIGKALAALHTEMAEFQYRVVDAVGAALGCDTGYFREMLEDGPVVNRAAWYPPMVTAPSTEHVWAVEHQDFDLITALPRATAAGLQVKVDGEWFTVTPPDGYAVINAGMVLDRLTGGAIPAAMHRVVSPPGATAGRLSIVQFCHPTPWTVLTPLPLPAGVLAPRHYPTLTAGDLFERTMYRINRLEPARG
jgi:isopenicillin N synthase-like dioxygenase